MIAKLVKTRVHCMANKKDKYMDYSNCESVRMNSRVTKITIHCLLLTPFLSGSSLKIMDFPMLYSEAIAVLEIPLSSFSRILIFCSIDKVTRFLLGLSQCVLCLHLVSATTWLAQASKVGMATLHNQILQEHAVWLTGQFG